jgi:hypothetical protein
MFGRSRENLAGEGLREGAEILRKRFGFVLLVLAASFAFMELPVQQSKGEKSKTKDFIIRIFSNPWFGGIAAFCGIVGIPLSIYLAREKKPELCYRVYANRTSIVKAGQLSEMSVFVDGKQATGDLTAAQVQVWNDGTKAIHNNDILSARGIVLRTTSGTQIYKAICKPIRSESDFGIITTNILAGKIGLTWKVLEKSDGALITVFYAGDENTRIVVDGTIEGQGRVANLSAEDTDFNFDAYVLAPSTVIFGLFYSAFAWHGIGGAKGTAVGLIGCLFTLGIGYWLFHGGINSLNMVPLPFG